MAAQPPTGPVPPNDGSSIFRRSPPKSSAKNAPPPIDDLNPDEPTDLVDVDPESVPLDELPRGMPTPADTEPADSDLVAEQILFDDDGPLTEPLGGASDSSVALDASFRPAVAGSGWLDPPAPSDVKLSEPPSTGKYEDAAQMFADLSGTTPDSTTNWVKSETTGRVSDSELIRAFADARGSDDTPSELALERPDSDDNPRSSIFGKIPEQSSGIDMDEVQLMGSTDSGSISDLHADGSSGSSIFERSSGGTLRVPVPDEVGRLEFDLPKPTDPTGASQASGRIDLGNPDFTETGSGRPMSLDDLDLDAAEAAAAQSTGATRHTPTNPIVTPAAVRARSDRQAIEPRRAAAADTDPDDEPPGRFSKGLGKFVGGVAFGLLASGVTFAGLYLGGVIPNERKEANAVVKVPSADPDAAAKLSEVQKQLDDAKQAATTAKQEFDKQLAVEKKDAADAKKQVSDMLAAITKSNDTVAAAKAEAETAKKELNDAKKTAEGTMADLTAAKKDAATFKTELETAKKGATALKTELDGTKKAAEAAMTAVEKKRKDAEDALAGVVTELKAAKVLGPNDDVSKLPTAVKQFAAVANSGDVQKAAEALLAARKEADTLKANLKTAMDEAAKAKDETAAARTAADKIKTDADKAVAAIKAEGDKAIVAMKAESEKAVADAKKDVDSKVKAAVDAATKDTTAALAKAQRDVETAKAAGRAEGEKTAKAQLDLATARVAALEATGANEKRNYEEKLRELTARLTDAKSGAVVQVTSVESAAMEKAGRSYADGLTAFSSGKVAEAEKLFAAATQYYSGDARYWYFLGLSRHQQGKTAEAEAAFKRGAELESRGRPNPRLVSEAFERLPLDLRKVVKLFRP